MTRVYTLPRRRPPGHPHDGVNLSGPTLRSSVKCIRQGWGLF